jgi:hypothetical protein
VAHLFARSPESERYEVLAMPVEISRRSVVVRWPVAFEVTLEIDPESVADDATVGIVGIRLVNMAGSFVS